MSKSGGDKLVLTFTFPEGACDDEVVATIRRLVGELDGLHRAMGGHGLKVVRSTVPDPDGCPECGQTGFACCCGGPEDEAEADSKGVTG